MYKQSPEKLLFALSMSTCKQVDQTHIFVGQCLYCTLFMANDSNTFTFVPHALYSALFEVTYLNFEAFGKTPVVSPPAMTVAKQEMCHSGALKPMMHTECDFFSPRWINAFARLRTWKIMNLITNPSFQIPRYVVFPDVYDF